MPVSDRAQYTHNCVGQNGRRCLYQLIPGPFAQPVASQLCGRVSFADLQHHLLGSVQPGTGPQHPGPALQGGQQRLPRRQGSRQRHHRPHALAEGHRQGNPAVSQAL